MHYAIDALKHEVVLNSHSSFTCHSQDMVSSVLTLQVSTSFLTILLVFFYNFPKCTVTSSWTPFLPLSHNPFISILKNLLKADLHKENIVMTLTYKEISNLEVNHNLHTWAPSRLPPWSHVNHLRSTEVLFVVPLLHCGISCILTDLFPPLHHHPQLYTPIIFLFFLQDTASAISYLRMLPWAARGQQDLFCL